MSSNHNRFVDLSVLFSIVSSCQLRLDLFLFLLEPPIGHALGTSSVPCSVLGMTMGMTCLCGDRTRFPLMSDSEQRKATEYSPGAEDWQAETARSSDTHKGSSFRGSSPHQSGPWRSCYGVDHTRDLETLGWWSQEQAPGWELGEPLFGVCSYPGTRTQASRWT